MIIIVSIVVLRIARRLKMEVDAAKFETKKNVHTIFMNSHYCYYWVIIIYPTFSILSKTCLFPVIFLFSLIMEGLWHFRVNAALNASIEYLNFKLGCNTPQFQCFLCSHQRNRHWRLIYVADSFNLLIFILLWYIYIFFFQIHLKNQKT